VFRRSVVGVVGGGKQKRIVGEKLCSREPEALYTRRKQRWGGSPDYTDYIRRYAGELLEAIGVATAGAGACGSWRRRTPEKHVEVWLTSGRRRRSNSS
jgi:hypothetical protein